MILLYAGTANFDWKIHVRSKNYMHHTWNHHNKCNLASKIQSAYLKVEASKQYCIRHTEFADLDHTMYILQLQKNVSISSFPHWEILPKQTKPALCDTEMMIQLAALTRHISFCSTKLEACTIIATLFALTTPQNIRSINFLKLQFKICSLPKLHLRTYKHHAECSSKNSHLFWWNDSVSINNHR